MIDCCLHCAGEEVEALGGYHQLSGDSSVRDQGTTHLVCSHPRADIEMWTWNLVREARSTERSQVIRVTWTAGNSWTAEVPPGPVSGLSMCFREQVLL